MGAAFICDVSRFYSLTIRLFLEVKGFYRLIKTMSQLVTALSYAAIILAEGGKEVNEENLQALVEAANIVADPFVLGAFAKAASSLPVSKMVNDFGSAPVGGGAAAAPTGGETAGATAAPVEEEEEEEEQSSEAANIFGGDSSSEEEDSEESS